MQLKSDQGAFPRLRINPYKSILVQFNIAPTASENQAASVAVLAKWISALSVFVLFKLTLTEWKTFFKNSHPRGCGDARLLITIVRRWR